MLVLVCVQTFQIYLGYTFVSLPLFIYSGDVLMPCVVQLSGSLSSGEWTEGTGEFQCFGVGAMNMVILHVHFETFP